MKVRIASIVVLLFYFCMSSSAQSPQGIVFQAVAKDPLGNPAIKRLVNVKDFLLSGSSKGEIIFGETHQVLTNKEGVFTIILGKGTNTKGLFNQVNWKEGNIYLNVKISLLPTIPSAGFDSELNYQDMGTTQFWSVPYALSAGSVEGTSTFVKYADTSAMLQSLLSKKDTSNMMRDYTRNHRMMDSLTNVRKSLNTKLTSADTATMLSNYFRKTSLMKILELKANIESPVFTGMPIFPKGSTGYTHPANNNSNYLATTAYTDAAVKTAVTNSNPDASNEIKGKLQLAGDLTGTASLPLIADNAITTAKIVDSSVTDEKIVGVSGSKITGDLAPRGRLLLPIGEVSYFNTTGTVIPIQYAKTGSDNLVVCRPISSISSSTDFDNGGSNNARLRYIGVTTRMFHITVTLTGKPGNANDIFVFSLAKNGSVIPQSSIIQKYNGITDYQSNTLQVLTSMATNDYLELYIGNYTAAAHTITIHSINLLAVGY